MVTLQFENPNGLILWGLAMEDVCTFYGRLAYFMAVWLILWPFGLFYGRLAYFMAIGYIFWTFGLFFPVLVYCTKKTLATLVRTTQRAGNGGCCCGGLKATASSSAAKEMSNLKL
jgi:hypothetical protein